GNLPERQHHATGPEHGSDEVVIADRGAANGDDDLGTVCSCKMLLQAFAGVARDANELGSRASGFRQGGAAEVIGGNDLTSGRLPGSSSSSPVEMIATRCCRRTGRLP